jgi:hypothetical protein
VQYCSSSREDATDLMDCGVLGPETKLVVWDDVLAFQDRIETSKGVIFLGFCS